MKFNLSHYLVPVADKWICSGCGAFCRWATCWMNVFPLPTITRDNQIKTRAKITRQNAITCLICWVKVKPAPRHLYLSSRAFIRPHVSTNQLRDSTMKKQFLYKILFFLTRFLFITKKCTTSSIYAYGFGNDWQWNVSYNCHYGN